MSTRPSTPAAEPADQYLVSYGKSGAVGVFTAPDPLPLRRGATVVIETPRGTELGAVLCPATVRQARLLGAVAAGPLVRPATADDLARRQALARLGQQVYDAARAVVSADGLPVEVLDVECLLDGSQAVLQTLGGDDAALTALAGQLEARFGLAVRLENMSLAKETEEAEPAGGGCGKPGCGSEGGGGCSSGSCGTGGGCSSCGTGGVDMKQYFSHLRDKMEKQGRTPLL